MRIEALIFDMDGVITDTVELHRRAWERLTAEEGVPFTPEDNDLLRGLSRRDSLDYVFRHQPPDEAAAVALMERKNTYALQLIDHLTPADRLPGVTPLIEAARAAGIRIGLASSSQNVDVVLDRLDMHPLFDAVADHFSIVNHKPAPDVFLWTAGRLNAHPAQTIVFEDADAGVRAGLAGGFRVVGVGDPAIVGAAHLVVPDLTNVTLDGLRQAFT